MRLCDTNASMDVLSEVLRAIRLHSAIFFNAEFSSPWCFASPASHTMAPALAPGSNNVIIFHLLTEGRAYTRLEDGDRVVLEPGDIVTFPHGDPHYLGNGEGARAVDSATALPTLLAQGLALVRTGGGGEPSRFISTTSGSWRCTSIGPRKA